MQRYRAGYEQVRLALEGCTREELDRRPRPGAWTAREIVHHLGDSEMTSAIRLRRLIAEDGPLIQGYDQDDYSRRLFYDRPIEASLAAFKAARESTAEILERLPADAWARQGTHSESGAYSVSPMAGDLCGARAQPRRSDSAGAWSGQVTTGPD